MRIPVSEAKSQLTELVRRAETGDEIILTRHGTPVVRLTPISWKPDRNAKRLLMEDVMASVRGKVLTGPDAARSQDFLYDEDGLPK